MGNNGRSVRERRISSKYANSKLLKRLHIGWNSQSSPAAGSERNGNQYTNASGNMSWAEYEVKLTQKTNATKQTKGFGLGYHNKWPEEKTPLSVHGAIRINNVMCYLIKFKTTARVDKDDKTVNRHNAILVASEAARKLVPDLIIKFLERRIEWYDDHDDDDDE